MKSDNYDNFLNELTGAEQALNKNYLGYCANWQRREQEFFTFPGTPRTVAEFPPQNFDASTGNLAFPLTSTAVGVFLASCSAAGRRQEFYSHYAPPGRRGAAQKNLFLGRKILQLRRRKAQLLGFENYLAYAFADKMESSYAHIYNFLLEAITHVRPAYEAQLAILRPFARTHHQLKTLQPWDVLFVMNSYFDEFFGHDESAFAEYYPLTAVVPAALEILGQLLDLEFAATGNPGDGAYWVHESGGTRPLGQIKLNFTPAPPHRLHAAQAQLTAPPAAVPHVVLNCPAGADGLLAHGQLIMLFHEFGHAVERLFAAQNVQGIGGGIPETDVIEFYSKFLENFVLNEHILRKLSAHHHHGEKIPSWRLQAARRAHAFERVFMNYQSLIVALFDLTINLEIPANIAAAGRKLFAQHGYINATAINFACMPELFAPEAQSSLPGNFYSYVLSELLARQVYAQIARDRASVPALVTDYSVRDKFFAQSQRRSFYESYRDFSGRKTIQLDLDALITSPPAALN